MIVTYLRSSSYTCWDMCPQKYFIAYCLGIKENASKAATLGSIVHKSLEILSNKKLCIQNSENSFFEEETKNTFKIDEITSELAVLKSFEFYRDKESHLKLNNKDYEQCLKWFNSCLSLNNGYWNPLNRKIIKPELYFDIEFNESWAKYKYGEISGNLSIKGTVDLVTEIDSQTIEYIDWKTGARKDWATMEEKSWKKLMNDPQLMMYYYALRKAFPNKFIIMTIVFIKDGGAFSLPYDDSYIDKTEKMIKNRFNIIKNSVIPKLKKSFKCTSFCHFGKNNWEGTNVTICEYIKEKVKTDGIEKTMKEIGNSDFLNYQEGGGRSCRK